MILWFCKIKPYDDETIFVIEMNNEPVPLVFITQPESSFHAGPTPVNFRVSLKTFRCMVKNKQLNGLTEQSQNLRE